MNYFRDLAGLHAALTVLYEKVPSDERRAQLSRLLEEWGFTPEQASLYASSVLCQNVEASADWVRTNVLHVTGSWVRGEQQGNVGSWLSTMKETWTFNIDLTYEHKTERYEGSISTGPYFQSSYSRPTKSVQSGIWAPPDWLRDQLDLFMMSSNGFARQMKLEWVDNSNCDYRACSIDGQRFGRDQPW
ncbi:MAG TPA: hypothetical protein VH227_04175 [Candidatus Udaeobacter sp.]|jgi:hypothetical protein|nr:hypothetical protein [Candidatus Udaeobacter sp.]